MATLTQTRKLYDLELIFNPLSRNRYTVNLADGTTLTPPGVTTILGKTLAKEALMLWPMRMALDFIEQNADKLTLVDLIEQAAKQYVIKQDKGKDVGSIVHEAIESYLKGAEVEVTGAAAKSFQAFKEWFDKTKPKVLATEQIVYSKQHNYAGTFDALLEIDGKVILCDIKTTNVSRDAPIGIYPENFLQLGAYSLAFKEESALAASASDLMVINANKEGKLSTLRASDLGLTVSDCEDSFLNCLELYQLLTPLKKQIKEYPNESN